MHLQKDPPFKGLFFNDIYHLTKYNQIITRKINYSNNKIYIGVHKYNPEFCEPLVNTELFYRVQEKLKRNNRSSRTYVYIFSKLIKCQCCGKTLVGVANTTTKEPSYYYRCNAFYKDKLTNECTANKIFSEKRLETYLLKNIKKLLIDYTANIEKKNKPIMDNKNKINAIKKKMNRLKDLYIEELIDIETYKKDYKKYKNELDDLAPKAVNKASDSILQLLDINNIAEMYNTLTREDKRAFWQNLIKEIHIIDQYKEKYDIFFN